MEKVFERVVPVPMEQVVNVPVERIHERVVTVPTRQVKEVPVDKIVARGGVHRLLQCYFFFDISGSLPTVKQKVCRPVPLVCGQSGAMQS